ncbi:MAG: YicC/YloC family endoribonuclease [Polyangiales bacterium]
MTGFGVGEAELGAGRVCIEARSVNHRFLELRVRLPRELSDQSVYVEQLLRPRLSRGAVPVHWAGGLGGVALARARARAALRALRELGAELDLQGEVPLSLLSAVPDLFVPAADADRAELRAALARAAERCVAELDAMRCREGAALALDLAARLDLVRATHLRLVDLTARCAARYRERVKARVSRILEAANVRVDDARLEQEIVLLAEHTDVTEELTRLGAHTEHFGALLAAADPSGRRMDFVLQEMSREANTLGAKAIDAEISLQVVELKAELERLREQAQNVE